MIGLIRKDLSLFALNSKVFIIFIMVAIMLVFFGDSNTAEFMVTFASSYMAVMCGMQVISTITYDEFDNGGAFLMTLPITRKTYVYSKYIFTLIMTLLGGFTAFIITMIGCTATGMHNDVTTVISGCFGSLAVICVILAAMIPIQLKYGGEKGRIVLFALVAIILLVAFGAKKLGESLGINVDEVIKSGETFVRHVGVYSIVFFGIVAAVLIIAISLAISLKVIKDKEY